MGYVSYSALRENLARYMDETIASRAPIVVTRRRGKGAVVMMSLEEFESWQETIHLMSSPRNAEILRRSIRDADAGQVEEHDLLPAHDKPV